MTTTDARLPIAVEQHSSFPEFFTSAKRQPIHVILGVQGSGTNLLRSILVKAFNFSVVQDQSLVYNAALKVGTNPSADLVQQQFDAIRSRLSSSTLAGKIRRRIKINGSFTGIEEHFNATSIACGADLAQFIYAYGAFLRRTMLMAIKSDDLWETIGPIDTVLPNRRIILLTRDFRDNLLSITKKDFGPVDPLVAARYVKKRFACYEAEYRRMAPEHRIHVRYEDLLEAPDAFVARLAAHFGLATPGAPPPPVDTGRIRRHNVRKWARLSVRELAYCEGILREELGTYGYDLASEAVRPPGAAMWLLASGRDAVKRIPQKVRKVATRLRR